MAESRRRSPVSGMASRGRGGENLQQRVVNGYVLNAADKMESH